MEQVYRIPVLTPQCYISSPVLGFLLKREKSEQDLASSPVYLVQGSRVPVCDLNGNNNRAPDIVPLGAV